MRSKQKVSVEETVKVVRAYLRGEISRSHSCTRNAKDPQYLAENLLDR